MKARDRLAKLDHNAYERGINMARIEMLSYFADTLRGELITLALDCDEKIGQKLKAILEN